MLFTIFNFTINTSIDSKIKNNIKILELYNGIDKKNQEREAKRNKVLEQITAKNQDDYYETPSQHKNEDAEEFRKLYRNFIKYVAWYDPVDLCKIVSNLTVFFREFDKETQFRYMAKGRYTTDLIYYYVNEYCNKIKEKDSDEIKYENYKKIITNNLDKMYYGIDFVRDLDIVDIQEAKYAMIRKIKERNEEKDAAELKKSNIILEVLRIEVKNITQKVDMSEYCDDIIEIWGEIYDYRNVIFRYINSVFSLVKLNNKLFVYKALHSNNIKELYNALYVSDESKLNEVQEVYVNLFNKKFKTTDLIMYEDGDFVISVTGIPYNIICKILILYGMCYEAIINFIMSKPIANDYNIYNEDSENKIEMSQEILESFTEKEEKKEYKETDKIGSDYTQYEISLINRNKEPECRTIINKWNAYDSRENIFLHVNTVFKFANDTYKNLYNAIYNKNIDELKKLLKIGVNTELSSLGVSNNYYKFVMNNNMDDEINKAIPYRTRCKMLVLYNNCYDKIIKLIMRKKAIHMRSDGPNPIDFNFDDESEPVNEEIQPLTEEEEKAESKEEEDAEVDANETYTDYIAKEISIRSSDEVDKKCPYIIKHVDYYYDNRDLIFMHINTVWNERNDADYINLYNAFIKHEEESYINIIGPVDEDPTNKYAKLFIKNFQPTDLIDYKNDDFVISVTGIPYNIICKILILYGDCYDGIIKLLMSKPMEDKNKTFFENNENFFKLEFVEEEAEAEEEKAEAEEEKAEEEKTGGYIKINTNAQTYGGDIALAIGGAMLCINLNTVILIISILVLFYLLYYVNYKMYNNPVCHIKPIHHTNPIYHTNSIKFGLPKSVYRDVLI